MKRILGIDEAGRGAVLGPMVIAGALVKEKDLPRMQGLGLKDSKELSPSRRLKLRPQIEEVLEGFELVRIGPKEIDSKREHGTNLNEIEMQKMAQIINDNEPDAVYVDAVDSNEARFKTKLKNYIEVDIELTAEHEADKNYPVVSAASILAKVARDADMEELNRVYETELGSGYPSDPITKTFLKNWLQEHKKLPKITRTTWSTVSDAVKKKDQKSLDEW